MQLLSKGEKYPFNLPNAQGAIANFLRESTNTLIINISSLSPSEVKTLTKGTVRCGLVYEEGEMLLLWQFLDSKKRPVFTLDSPFDARLDKTLTLHNITSDQDRLVIDMHIIDASTHLIKGLRAITMPPELTLIFLSRVQDQLACSVTNRLPLIQWMKVEPATLLASTKVFTLGE